MEMVRLSFWRLREDGLDWYKFLVSGVYTILAVVRVYAILGYRRVIPTGSDY